MKYRLAATICSGISAAIGAIAWLGLALGNFRLAGLAEGLVPMAPSTALLFIAFGVAGILVVRASSRRRAARAALAITLIGAAIALPLLLLSLQGIYLDIELLGIRPLKQVGSVPLGHMSPISAFSFLAASISFLAILSTGAQKGKRATLSFWIAVALVGGYSMLALAYLLGTPMFYGGKFIPPAATTALAFMALGLALLFLSPLLDRPDPLKSEREAPHSSTPLVVVFILLVAGIVATGHFHYRNHEKHYLEEAGRQLSAIADLKLSEIALWRSERLIDASFYHNNPAFAEMVKSYLRTPPDRRARHILNSWLASVRANRNYDGIFLFDGQGRDRLSLSPQAGPSAAYPVETAREALISGRITFSDFYRDETAGKIHLNIMIPILDPLKTGPGVAVLSLRIDPERYLYPFLKRWPINSDSAETLIVARDGNQVLFLNNLRFNDTAALNLRIPLAKTETPAVMAVLGQTGIVKGIDYRGSAVFAALRAIPDSPWYLVSKMSIDEVNMPLQERLWITVTLIFTLLLCAATGVGLVWRQQRLADYRRSEKKSRLNLERLQCLVNVFQYAAADNQKLLDFALGEALRMTSSRFGYIYNYDQEKRCFILNSWSRDVMKECAVTDPQTLYELDKTGLWGEAVRQAKPIMTNDFAAPDPLKKGYPEGHVHLTRFLTIPLIDHGRIVAVVGVANKEEAYDDTDVLQLSLLMDAVWKVAERKRAEDDLKQKNAELERFMYTASHDLKSPLVTISTFLRYLEIDLKTADQARIQQDMDFIRIAADKMGQLLAELLELSRVGLVASKAVLVGYQDVVQEALQLVAGHISERGVTVRVQEHPLAFYGDRLRLVEIWQNLLENAVKYMGDQAEPAIEAGAEQVDGSTVFFVRDNGIGIDAKFQENIFGLFNKLDSESEGSGLGLALVRRIVEMYSGRIWVESQGDGQGSCFRFTLPGALSKKGRGPKAEGFPDDFQPVPVTTKDK